MKRTRDAAATRQRILDAATADFAAYGIAGARVDRIAAQAEVNKAQIYAYFGDKMSLFNAIFRRHAVAVVDATPFTATDLPAYAVGLYDAARSRPDLIRLLAWARLEGVNPPLDEDEMAAKLQAIADAQAAGVVQPDILPEEVLALVISTALTWSAMAPHVLAAGPEVVHERRRSALRLVVERSFVA